jgi:hypothetical protein
MRSAYGKRLRFSQRTTSISLKCRGFVRNKSPNGTRSFSEYRILEKNVTDAKI